MKKQNSGRKTNATTDPKCQMAKRKATKWENERGKARTKWGQPFSFVLFGFSKAKVADDAVAAVELVSVGCSRPVCFRCVFMWAKLNCSIITWPLEICILMAAPAFGTTYPQLCGVAAEKGRGRADGVKEEHGQRMATICVKCCRRRLMMPRINLQ